MNHQKNIEFNKNQHVKNFNTSIKLWPGVIEENQKVGSSENLVIIVSYVNIQTILYGNIENAEFIFIYNFIYRHNKYYIIIVYYDYIQIKGNRVI